MATAAGLSSTPWDAVTFNAAVPVTPAPAEEVAVTVTVAGLVGAVKTPALVMLPPPLTVQVNVAVGKVGWYAVNCTFPPIGTLAEPGNTVTALWVCAVEPPEEAVEPDEPPELLEPLPPHPEIERTPSSNIISPANPSRVEGITGRL
jgi:hypothetical protein